MPTIITGATWRIAYTHAYSYATHLIRFEVRGYKINGRWRYSSSPTIARRKRR